MGDDGKAENDGKPHEAAKPAPDVPLQNDGVRRAIVLSFWAFVIIGLPVWWHTTTLERRALPRAEIARWEAKAPCPVRFPIGVAIPAGRAGEDYPDAADIASQLAHTRTAQDSWLQLPFEAQPDENLPLGVDVTTLDCIDFYFGRHSEAEGLSVQGDAASGETRVDYALAAEAFLKVVAPLARTFSGAQDPRAAPYGSRYRLIFSLMNENATEGSWTSTWDIREALGRYVTHTLKSLSPAHNFTVETRTQRFAPLTFEPERITGQDGLEFSVVDEDMLKTFINENGWNLASPMSTETVLHFVLWVPSAEHRPFAIRSTDGSLDFSGAFIRPQWGGVVILDPSSLASDGSASITAHLSADELQRPTAIFVSQFLALLGVAPLGLPLNNLADLHSLQVEAALRRRTLETMTDAIHSLASLLKLVKEQTNMRVGGDVQRQVDHALRELKLANKAASVTPLPSLAEVLLHARLAQSYATRAFYNPSLLGLLYFPDEHRYAIYTPLFGPLAVPLLASALREIKAWKKRRRQEREPKKKIE